MPHIWNNIAVVTYEELVPRFYASEASLSVVIKRSEKRGFGLKRVQRAHMGGIALIDYDSLPLHIREALPDPRKGKHILEYFFAVDSAAVEYYQNYRFVDGSALSEEHQSLYIANASMIKAVYKLKEARIGERKSKGHRNPTHKIWQTLCNDYLSFKNVLADKFELVCDLPDNYRRFAEKCVRFKDCGYEFLISKKHLNINGQKVDADHIKILESIFATQSYKPTATEVHEQYDAFLDGYIEVINNATGECYNPKDYKKLSKGTVMRYLAEWQSKAGTAILRTGDRQKLLNRYSPHHSFDIPKFAGSIISVDDRQPPFVYDKTSRVWFYIGTDVHSLCFTTWVYGKTKEGLILDFYRQMVRNYYEWGLNLPAEIEAEASLNSSYKNTFLREGAMFEYVHIEANNARAKKIERIFGRVRYEIEKKREGWMARPTAKSEANEVGTGKVTILPYDQIVKNALADIEKWNNMPCDENPQKSRWEQFVENQNPDLKPTNYRLLIPLLGYTTKRTSCNRGIVQLQGREMLIGDNGSIKTGEDLIKLMKIVEGEEISVKWLDDNDGHILKAYAFIGDKYVCELFEKPKYQRARIERTGDDEKAQILMSSYKATIDGYCRAHKNEIDKVTIIDNRQIIVNNKFRIRELSDALIIRDELPVEIAPERDDFEYELETVETTFKPSLKDRF
jgi:hypothetical protein